MALQVFLPSIASVSGEIVGVYLLRARGISAASAISMMAMLSLIIIFSIALFCLGCITVLILGHHVFKPITLLTINIGIIVCLCVFVYYALRLKLLQKIMRQVQKYLPINTWQLNARFVESWFRWYFRHWQILFVSSLWQMAQYLLIAINIFLAAWALDIPLSLFAAIALVATLIIAGMVGFFLPESLGAQEFGFVATGAMFGLSPTEAMALAMVQRVCDFIIYPPVLLLWKFKLGEKILARKTPI